jgi:hypothetical protein
MARRFSTAARSASFRVQGGDVFHFGQLVLGLFGDQRSRG